MSQKHIFIGLGGSGVNTVSQIKYKIYQKIADSKRFEKMNERYRFLFLDTDSRDVEKYNKQYYNTFENGTIPFINPQTDLVSLALGNPHSIYREAELNPEPLINNRILEACSPELAAKIPDQPLKFGAGAFRMKSRISFARSLSEFQQKLQAHIEDLNNVKNSGGEENTIFYWVVCSTNGGTGSGIINDILYYVNMQHNRSVGDGDPHLVLVMYMPKFYIDKNSTEEKYSTNAFAVFSEIEAFKSMSMDELRNKVFHRLAFTKDYNLIDEEHRYDPFYYLIPIDCQTDNGTNIGDAMYQNTAEMLYYIHDGQGGTALHSDVDNYMHDLYNQRPDGFLVPMGYIALRKPEEEFRQYMAARIEKDILVHGLLNKDNAPFLDDSKVKAFYDDVFSGFPYDAEMKTKKDELLTEMVDLNQTTDTLLLPDGWEPSKAEAVAIAFHDAFHPKEIENKNTSISYLKARLWDKTEKLIKEFGFKYTKDMIDALQKEGIERCKYVIGYLDEHKDPSADNKLQELYEPAAEYKLTERVNKSNQKEEVRAFCTALNTAAGECIDREIMKYKREILESFCDKDGHGEIAELRLLLESLLKTAEYMATDARDKYAKLANSFNDKSMDVTSVYLPEIKTICDGEGWVKDNVFSKWYNTLIAATQGEDGKDKLPMRNGTKSLESFINEVYSVSGPYAKDILKEYQVNNEIRFFVNENLTENRTAAKRIEDFVIFAKKTFEKKIEQDQADIARDWTTRGISSFFSDLNNMDKERIRRSLSPCLFFNYKSNKIAIDYREFLIFVTSDRELAKQMLGYQEGNPNHKFIKSQETNAAFVLRAKYGLSFRDYRLYDNLKEIYDKAPFREKFHFHRYFAEYGAKILPENLPYEISPAHKTFAKLLLIREYDKELEPFFYKSPYKCKANSFANSILLIDESDGHYNGMFSMALPKAISDNNGQMCLTVEDNNAKFYVTFEGLNFIESFHAYENDFIHYSIQQTYQKYIACLYRQRAMINKPIDEEGNTEEVEIVGEKIISDFFQEKRKTLLDKFDNMACKAKTENEKKIYRILFKVLDEEITNVRHLI